MRMVAAALLAGLALLPAAAHAAERPMPIVIRGSEGADSPLVQVMRGNRGPSATETATADAGRAERGSVTVAAGRTLWMIDEANGELRACRMYNTTQVGGRVISCRTRDLGR